MINKSRGSTTTTGTFRIYLANAVHVKVERRILTTEFPNLTIVYILKFLKVFLIVKEKGKCVQFE